MKPWKKGDLLGRNRVGRSPDRGRIESNGEIFRDRSVDAFLVRSQVGQEQIAADPRHDGGDVALEARNIPDRQAKADKGRWIENVDILQVGSATWFFFEIFVSRAEIRIRREALVLLVIRRCEPIAPAQDLASEIP